MKNIFTLTLIILGFNLFSQTDTTFKKSYDSFEDYKKKESNKFLNFKEKRDQEIKEFISNEENWNLITIETKGNVKENIAKISKPEEKKPEEKVENKIIEKQVEPKLIEKDIKPKVIKDNIETPSYVSNEKKKPLKENNTYHHPLKNSKFRISSPFGFRIHPIYKTKRFHSGTDYAASKGIPIYSITDGTVIRAGVAKGYGNYIVIDHSNGLKSAYAHMSSMNVKKGNQVKKGNKIGEVGMSGSATGNHLHFEIIKNNKKVNPKLYVSK